MYSPIRALFEGYDVYDIPFDGAAMVDGHVVWNIGTM